jgi:Ca2+-binding EF-hand superfamily protein
VLRWIQAESAMAVGHKASVQRHASMDDEALLALRRVFDTVDTDGSGAIGLEELGTLLETLGQAQRSQAELRQAMQLRDVDNSGEVEFEEFSQMLLQWQRDDLRSVFGYFDRDESGEIDLHEFREALQALGQSISPEQLDVLVTQADTDGSGSIALDEFCAFVQPYMSMTSAREYEVQDVGTGERCQLTLTSVGCELARASQNSPRGEVELLPYFRIADAQVKDDVLAVTRYGDRSFLFLRSGHRALRSHAVASRSTEFSSSCRPHPRSALQVTSWTRSQGFGDDQAKV